MGVRAMVPKLLVLVAVSALAAGCTTGTETNLTQSSDAGSAVPSPSIPRATAIEGSIVFAKDGDIYRIEGDDERNLTDTEADEAAPAWSSDGRQILFTRREAETDLYVMKADGTDQKQLTRTPEEEWAAGWSPDGTQIAFATFSDAEGGAVWVMNADGTDQHVIYKDENAFIGLADWSPDGRTLLLGIDSAGGGQLDLFVIGLNGKNLTRLTTNEGDDSGGRWSPETNQIVFWSDGYPPREGPGIYLMNSDGRHATRVLRDNMGLDTVAFSWSPDGDQIAWTAKYEGGAGSPIFLMNSDGTDLQQLTQALSGSSSLDWAD